jgi:hypothetical protein
MRWLSNILPGERNLYLGITVVVMFFIASLVASNQM